MIGGSAASLSCFAENSPEAIIASATSQAVNPSLTVVEESNKSREISESENFTAGTEVKISCVGFQQNAKGRTAMHI